MKLLLRLKGGPGSGHRGHIGRPGKRGGSMAGTTIILSDSEASALRSYTWLSAQTINSELREGKVSTSKPFGTGRSNAEQVELMDSAISKASPIKSDTTLYSKMDAGYLIREGKLNVGEVISNPGYLSTTTRERGVQSYPGQEYTQKALLTLHIPKGTKGVLPLGAVSQYPQEREHLIHRGSSYKILSINIPWHTYIDPVTIEAELIQ